MTSGLTLTTPSLLFSAISLLLLAYTNRFLSYAQLLRNLQDKVDNNGNIHPTNAKQIRNLVLRLELIRAMQILGATSLLCCIVAMFFLYIESSIIAGWIFGVGMLLLAASLTVCIIEIQISVRALYYNLQCLSDENLYAKLKKRTRWFYLLGIGGNPHNKKD